MLLPRTRSSTSPRSSIRPRDPSASCAKTPRRSPGRPVQTDPILDLVGIGLGKPKKSAAAARKPRRPRRWSITSTRAIAWFETNYPGKFEDEKFVDADLRNKRTAHEVFVANFGDRPRTGDGRRREARRDRRRPRQAVAGHEYPVDVRSEGRAQGPEEPRSRRHAPAGTACSTFIDRRPQAVDPSRSCTKAWRNCRPTAARC